MEHRLGRTLRVFLIALAATGFYRLTMVPLIERSADEQAVLEPTAEEAAAIRARAASRLASLGDIFPEGSWERDDPTVLESNSMRLLFKEYHTLPDGRMNLVPCTLVMLPEPSPDGQPKGRTVVMRAPQGAVLEFEEPIDPAQGRLSKLIGGNLRGEVSVRGTATTPGGEDEIEINTRDLELAENRLQTIEAVQFRYGRSRGSGRGFVARLLSKPGESSDRGPAINGVESMRLERDVQILLEGMAGGFLPGSEATAEADGPAPPVLVRCRGSLEFGVVSRLITLTDHVDVSRTLPDGGIEQLVADRLSILLADEAAAADADGPDTGSLRPVELEARGSPVVARSTEGGLEARAERLGYEIATKRILLDGEQPVMLLSPDAELEARSVDYVPGPPGSPGALMAVGPGWFESRATPEHGPVRLAWKKWLRVRPDGDGHVASVAGDAEVSFESQGRLAASEMHLWLEIDQAAAETRPARAGAGGVSLAGVKPTRMLARGIVETDAPQLAARSDRLEIWFRHPKPVVAPRPAAPAATAAATPPPPPSANPPPPPPEAPAAEAPEAADRGRIVASGALMRGLVDMKPEGPVVAEISLEDSVRLIEEPLAGQSEPQLVIEGDQLQVVRPTGFDARATVAGRPAKISGRGMELEGPLVEVDRGRNRMTVDGAGRMRLPVAGGGLGLEALATGSTPAVASPAASGPAEPLDVTWQGRMDFDGLTARFIDRVVTSSGEGRLEAGSLDVVLDRPFDFSQMAAGGSRGQADVARIACGSGVKIHNVSGTTDGSRSVERLYVRDLLIDRTTGNVLGNGPGRLENVRLGQAPGFEAPSGLAGPGQPSPPPQAKPDELTYLAVDFQKGLSGNLGRRVL